MKLKNLLLTGAGFLLLGLGFAGAFLPLLPTTPFVLLASACFAGNPKARAWLMRNPFFAEYLQNYQARNGLKKATVIKSLGFLWLTLGISMVVVAKLWCTLLLLCVGAAVTTHILWIAKPKKAKEAEVKKHANHPPMV